MSEEMRKLITLLMYCNVEFKVEPSCFTYEITGKIGSFHWLIVESETINKLNFYSENPEKRVYCISAILCLSLITSEKDDYERKV